MIDGWVILGFIDRSDFDSTFYKIQKMLVEKYIGFPMVFDHLETMDLTKYKMLCLMPDVSTKKMLIDLKKDIDSILKFKSDLYNPHISLGKFRDDSWMGIKSIQHVKYLNIFISLNMGMISKWNKCVNNVG